MTTIESAITAVQLGEPVGFKAMGIFPLVTDRLVQPGYLTLQDALLDNQVHISEISVSGAVPELRFHNEADLPVLLVDGEELVGGKQNRVINLTILVPAKTAITIPVSCVEAGRWRNQSTSFKDTGRAHFAKGRASKTASVSESMKHHGSRRSDQGQIWDDISMKLGKLNTVSDTSAMASLFDKHATSIKDYIHAFTAASNQAGAVFVINGRIAGIEIFDSVVTFQKYFSKLVQSYALDAMEIDQDHVPLPSSDAATGFIAEINRAKTESYPALGAGQDVRLSTPRVVGGALEYNSNLIHLVAFARPHGDQESSLASGGIARQRARSRFGRLQ